MAGITWLEEFQQPALRGLVDATVENKEITSIDSVLPDDKIFSTQFAYDVFKRNSHIAPYIGFGAETPKIDRDAVASKSGDVGKMGIGYVITEEEMLALNMARSNSEKGAMIERLAKKGIDLVNAILLQVKYSKLQAIGTGRFQHNSNGVVVDFDFGIPAENKVVLTGAETWDNPDKDILGDLIEWTNAYVDTNGHAPDLMYMPLEVYRLFSKNATIIAEARGGDTGATRISDAEVTEVLGRYGIPKIEVVTQRTATVENMYTKEAQVIEMFPANRVVMVSNGIGNFLYGITVENNFQPGINLSAHDYNHPIRSVMDAVASGFPIIERPDAVFHADVIEGK